MFRHLPPTATEVNWAAQRASYAAQPSDVTRFRSALEGYLDVPACFLAASGRTALYMLLTTLRDGTPNPERTEVVLPAYTCPSVAKVVIDAGLRPRFVDIGPYTLTYNTSELAIAVSPLTLAVVVVHPFGIPHPLRDAISIAHQCGALVIEDAAQSMGAKLDGRLVGTASDFGLFSLGPGKPLSTGGGGFVCTTSETAAQLLRRAWKDLPESSGFRSTMAAVRLSLMNAAFHPSGWWLASRLGAQRVGENEASWGYAQMGLSAAQAAAGMALLPQLDTNNAVRREHGEQLLEALQAIPNIHLPGARLKQIDRSAGEESRAPEPIFLRFPIVFDSDAVRESAFRQLQSAGIGAGKMYRKSLATQFPDYADGVYPGAEHVASCLLTLPTHHYVADNDIVTMAELLAASVQHDAGTLAQPQA